MTNEEMKLPPLHKAVADGDIAEVIRLIDSGADVNAKNILGWTPLHIAAGESKTKTALTLIKEGAGLFVRTDKGKTPLDIAIQEHGEDSEIVRAISALMEEAEDREWAQKARRAKKQGFASRAESDALLREINAANNGAVNQGGD